jgi:hypothetical protein
MIWIARGGERDGNRILGAGSGGDAVIAVDGFGCLRIVGQRRLGRGRRGRRREQEGKSHGELSGWAPYFLHAVGRDRTEQRRRWVGLGEEETVITVYEVEGTGRYMANGDLVRRE